MGTRRLFCNTPLVVTATHVAHPCPFATAGTTLLCRGEKLRRWKPTKRHMEWRCDRTTNLGPGTKPPLGFVNLVGGDFGPWGNRVAAGTLGQFTILWKGGHIHPFMQWLTKWKYCNNICPWPPNTTNIRHSSSHMGQSLTKLNYIPSALRLRVVVFPINPFPQPYQNNINRSPCQFKLWIVAVSHSA